MSNSRVPSQSQTSDERDKQNWAQAALRYLEGNAPLAAMKGAAVFPTQPFQSIMRAQQTSLVRNGKMVSIIEAARSIHTGTGPSGFMRGAGAGAIKEVLKSGLYKVPVLQGTPAFVGKFISRDDHHVTHAVVSGMAAGFLDSVCGGPLDSAATYRTTSQGKEKDAKFLGDMKAQKSVSNKAKVLFQSSYRGFLPTWGKTSIAMSAFFGAKGPIQRSVDQHLGVKAGEERPMSSKLFTALFTGVAVAGASAPLDIFKTLKQMPNPNNEKLWAVMNAIVQKHGVRGLGAGLGLKCLMVLLGWGINEFAIAEIEKKMLVGKSSSHDQRLFVGVGKGKESAAPVVVEVKSVDGVRCGRQP